MIEQCVICPHLCKLEIGEYGKCGARTNIEGAIVARNYGLVAACALDPIEKKPLYHYYPGKHILSIGTFGCNFTCQFCQNWQLAHGGEKGEFLAPKRLVEMAKGLQEQGNIGVAFTYSEPLMWYEYLIDCLPIIKAQGLQNVLITNGFINSKPLQELLPNLDATNIDIKSFDKKFYKEIAGGELKVVLNNIVSLKKAGVHVELTYLVVPTLNDSYQEAKAMVKWIREEVGRDTPLHITRYFPNYKLQIPATSLEVMERCYEVAKEELAYVYLGNVYK
jgi:pyruvate formate lyase activating enzyme